MASWQLVNRPCCPTLCCGFDEQIATVRVHPAVIETEHLGLNHISAYMF